jgi:hypothetical protein
VAQTVKRPWWARTLDVVADVVLGVGVAVALLMLLGGLAVVVGLDGSGVGQWLADTGSALLGPLDDLMQSWLTIEDERLAQAAALGIGGVAWAVAGWLLSLLVRPG